jgi:hypothetical protein
LLIKENGGKLSKSLTIQSDKTLRNMDTFMRAITEATGLKRYNDATIYSEDGLELEEDDIGYIKDGDTIYFESEGR